MSLPKYEYLNESRYADPEHNNTDRRPERELMQIFSNNGVHPIEAAQILVASGLVTVALMALTLGDTAGEVRAFLVIHCITVLDAAPLLRAVQVASFVSAWEDCKGAKQDLASARRKADMDSTAKPIVAPPARKAQLRATYRATAHHAYYPLSPCNNPHDKFWDDADTRLYRCGFFPFYYIFEVRSTNEIVGTHSSLSSGLGDYVRLSERTNLATTVTTIEDVYRRLVVMFVLASMMNQLAFQRGLAYVTTLKDWATRMCPSVKSMIQADQNARQEVDRLLTDERHLYKDYQAALDYVRANLLESKFCVEAIIQHGTVHQPADPKVQGGSVTAQLKNAGPSLETAEGHLIPSQHLGGASEGDDLGGVDKLQGRSRKGPGGKGRGDWTPVRKAPTAKRGRDGFGEPNTSGASAKKKARLQRQFERWGGPSGWESPGGHKGRGKDSPKGKANPKGKDHPKGKYGAKGKDSWARGGPKGGKAQIPAEEKVWYNGLAHWTKGCTGGDQLCQFYNSSIGCSNPACRFKNKCFICGQDHPAFGNHATGSPVEA